MSESKYHNELPDRETLIKYLKGDLSSHEQRRIEQLMLENPLVRDMMEGLEAAGPEAVEKDLEELENRISNRIAKKSIDRIPLFRIAAVFVLLVIAGAVIYLFITPLNEPDRQQELSMHQPATTDSISEDGKISSGGKDDSSMAVDDAANVRTTDSGLPETENIPEQSVLRAEEREKTGQKIITEAPPVNETVKEDQIFTENGLPPGLAEDETLNGLTGQDDFHEEITVVEDRTPDASRDSGIEQYPVQKNNQVRHEEVQTEQKLTNNGRMKRVAEPADASRFEATASLPGPLNGFDQFNMYLRDSLQYPEEALRIKMEGRVILSFIVDEDSIPENITVEQSLGYGCDEEAIRLIREGPEWIPYTMNGEVMEKRVLTTVEFLISDK